MVIGWVTGLFQQAVFLRLCSEAGRFRVTTGALAQPHYLLRTSTVKASAASDGGGSSAVIATASVIMKSKVKARFFMDPSRPSTATDRSTTRTAGDRQDNAGDVAGASRRSEEHIGGRNFFRLSRTAQCGLRAK